jgi:pimeloyl-ACP methyl ester carboxylesterase
MRPQTKYARSGDVNIAYQVVGDGPVDLIFVMGWVSNIDHFWDEPGMARFLERLSSFSRLITFDKRGTGMSDRVPVDHLPTLEQRMDDVRAVMDAVGSERAALMGVSEGGAMCMLFGATYPERTTALIILGGYARSTWAPDYSWARTSEELETFLAEIKEKWGGPVGLGTRAPSKFDDPQFRDWWSGYLRAAASPAAVAAITHMNSQIDVRHVLPAIRVPTLVIHAARDRALSVEHGRYLAAHISGARYVELDSQDHLPWVMDADVICEEVGEFLTGHRPNPEPDRVLATVLFTDMVASTDRASEIGDRRWRDIVEAHNSISLREIERFRGRPVKSTGDGFLATFDGPARAIRCASSLMQVLGSAGIEIRAGLHTGECEVVDGDLHGIAVHTGARISALAGAGEVLVSSTVKDLVAGSGIEFRDRGTHNLKGVPGDWRLFQVERV